MSCAHILAAALGALLACAAGAQEATPQPGESKPGPHVVPYCIEPMETMPAKIVALIDPQFRCASGTHLKRDSRPTIVVPTGEEISAGRPFVLRFEPPEKANAWFVRGYTTEQ
jgi:hypothetical protein